MILVSKSPKWYNTAAFNERSVALVTSCGLKAGKYRWTAEMELSLDDLFGERK